MKRTLTLMTIVAALAVAGCSGTRKTQKTETPRDTIQAESVVAAEPAAPAELAEPLREVMSVNCEYEGMTAVGQVRMQQDSAIWVSLSYFFELGRALATRDSVFIDAKVAGKRYRGTYADLTKRTGVAITFNELQDMLGRETAGDELSAIAKRLGYDINIRLSNRRKVEKISFPFADTPNKNTPR